MKKKSQNNSQKNHKIIMQSHGTTPIQQLDENLKGTQQIIQLYNQQQVFQMMSPLLIPPKFTQSNTAVTSTYHNSNTQIRVIQTPFHNNNSAFKRNDIDCINEDLEGISERIDWQKSPLKSQQDNNQDEQDSQSQQNDNMIPQESYNNISSENEQLSEVSIERPHIQNIQPIEKRRSYKKTIEIKQVPQPNKQNKKVTCNCKKTKCLKLYCDCFRINQTCQGCNCVGCHNLEEYASERNNSIIVLMDRNPDPFSQKIQADKHAKGCNCKKSYCLKKYCQCYQAGLKCGQNCKCQQCKNGGHQKQAHLQENDQQSIEKSSN